MTTEHDQKQNIHLHVSGEPAQAPEGMGEEFIIRSGNAAPEAAQLPAKPDRPVEPQSSGMKSTRWYPLAALFIILLVSTGPALGLMRTQALSTIATTLAPNAPWYAENQLDLANAYKADGKPAMARKTLEQLLTREQSHPQSGLKVAYVKLLLAQEALSANNFPEYEKLWKEAVAQIDATKNKTAENYPAGITDQLLAVAHRYDSNQDETKAKHDDKLALSLYELALAHWAAAPGSDTVSNVHAYVAQLYEDSNQPQKALDHFVSAYDAFKQCGDTSYNAYRLMHIGINLNSLQKYSQAETILKKALPIVEKSWNYSGNVLQARMALAQSELGLHKFKEAKEILKSALDYSSNMDNGYYWCWLKYYLAQAELGLGNHSQAQALFKEVLKLNADYNGPDDKAVAKWLASLPAPSPKR